MEAESVMHHYWAMGKARELWGDDARVRMSICVQNDGRLNLLYEVGYWNACGQVRMWGGSSWDEAFAHVNIVRAVGRVFEAAARINAALPGRSQADVMLQAKEEAASG